MSDTISTPDVVTIEQAIRQFLAPIISAVVRAEVERAFDGLSDKFGQDIADAIDQHTKDEVHSEADEDEIRDWAREVAVEVVNDAEVSISAR